VLSEDSYFEMSVTIRRLFSLSDVLRDVFMVACKYLNLFKLKYTWFLRVKEFHIILLLWKFLNWIILMACVRIVTFL